MNIVQEFHESTTPEEIFHQLHIYCVKERNGFLSIEPVRWINILAEETYSLKSDILEMRQYSVFLGQTDLRCSFVLSKKLRSKMIDENVTQCDIREDSEKFNI